MKKTLTISIIAFFLFVGAREAFATAVAFDAFGTVNDATASTSVTYTTLTVGSGSNRALLVSLSSASGVPVPQNFALTWDTGGTNQAMTLIASTTDPNHHLNNLWGLVAPTSGNKKLLVTWTGSHEIQIQAISFTGANQTGGATTFKNSGTNSGNSAAGTITVTSGQYDATVSNDTSGSVAGISSVSPTQFYKHSGSGSVESGGSYTTGSSTPVMTSTWSTTDQWTEVATDIAAVGTTTATTPALLMTIPF